MVEFCFFLKPHSSSLETKRRVHVVNYKRTEADGETCVSAFLSARSSETTLSLNVYFLVRRMADKNPGRQKDEEVVNKKIRCTLVWRAGSGTKSWEGSHVHKRSHTWTEHGHRAVWAYESKSLIMMLKTCVDHSCEPQLEGNRHIVGLSVLQVGGCDPQVGCNCCVFHKKLQISNQHGSVSSEWVRFIIKEERQHQDLFWPAYTRELGNLILG